jgi:hypothetical protein
MRILDLIQLALMTQTSMNVFMKGTFACMLSTMSRVAENLAMRNKNHGGKKIKIL